MADELFQLSDRPRILLTIGIPGSGKSYVSHPAKQLGWNVICSDEMRKTRLLQLKESNGHIIVDGKAAQPDEMNPKHIFSAELRTWVFDELRSSLQDALESRQNIVFDATNTNLQRVYFMNMARHHGYSVEALIFRPNKNLDVHIGNIENRVRSGGVDISFDGSRNKRVSIVQKVLDNYLCFLGSIKENREFHEFEPLLASGFNWDILRNTPRDFATFLSHLSLKDKTVVLRLQKYDIFNRIYYRDVTTAS